MVRKYGAYMKFLVILRLEIFIEIYAIFHLKSLTI